MFKLADLRELYDRRLEQRSSDWSGTYVHRKRFKELLLEKLRAEWSAFSEGHDVYTSHKKTVGAAVAQTSCLQVTEDVRGAFSRTQVHRLTTSVEQWQ